MRDWLEAWWELTRYTISVICQLVWVVFLLAVAVWVLWNVWRWVQ